MIVRPKGNKKRKKNKAHKIDNFKKNYIRTIDGVEIYAYPHFKPSEPEKRIRNYLRRKEIEYIREVNIGGEFRYDFLLPRFKFLIEYDGQKYHDSPSAMLNDQKKDKLAEQKGFVLFRLHKAHWKKLEQHVEDIILRGILERMYMHYQ